MLVMAAMEEVMKCVSPVTILQIINKCCFESLNGDELDTQDNENKPIASSFHVEKKPMQAVFQQRPHEDPTDHCCCNMARSNSSLYR